MAAGLKHDAQHCELLQQGSLACFPILDNGQCKGALSIHRDEPWGWTQDCIATLWGVASMMNEGVRDVSHRERDKYEIRAWKMWGGYVAKCTQQPSHAADVTILEELLELLRLGLGASATFAWKQEKAGRPFVSIAEANPTSRKTDGAVAPTIDPESVKLIFPQLEDTQARSPEWQNANAEEWLNGLTAEMLLDVECKAKVAAYGRQSLLLILAVALAPNKLHTATLDVANKIIAPLGDVLTLGERLETTASILGSEKFDGPHV